MKKLSLKDKLLNRFRELPESQWIAKGTICDSPISEGYLHETIGRALRDMAEERRVDGKVIEPVLEVSYYKGKSGVKLARYRAIPRKVKEVWSVPVLDKQIKLYEN